eukprot:251974-Chlamydomonas_euryale.AAC.1
MRTPSHKHTVATEPRAHSYRPRPTPGAWPEFGATAARCAARSNRSARHHDPPPPPTPPTP